MLIQEVDFGFVVLYGKRIEDEPMVKKQQQQTKTQTKKKAWRRQQNQRECDWL